MSDACLSFALLIGVDSYAVFDGSGGRPRVGHDLKGARNDVRRLVAVARQLGCPDERILVLTEPHLDPAALGLPAENVRGAGLAAILHALTEVSEIPIRNEGLPGLFAWSGRGAWEETNGLQLCPADTARGPGGLRRTLPLDTLADRLPVGSEVLLDTAYTGPERSLTPEAVVPAYTPRLTQGHHVYSAAAVELPAREYLLDGEAHGALIWAAALAMERWAEVPLPEGAGSQFTPAGQWARISGLLDALAIPQRVTYVGPRWYDLLRLTYPGEIWAGHDDTFTPFEVVDGSGATRLGWCVVVGATCEAVPSPFRMKHDYWYWSSSPWPAVFRLIPRPAGTLPPGFPVGVKWTSAVNSPIDQPPVPVPRMPGTWLISMAGVSGPVGAMVRQTSSTGAVQTWYRAQSGGTKYLGDQAEVGPTLTFDATKPLPAGCTWGWVALTEGS